MTNPDDEQVRALVSPTTTRALKIHKFGSRNFSSAIRLIVATASSIVPGTGGIPEALSILRDRDLEQRLELFDRRLSEVEGSVQPLAIADAYLATARGREHVISILEVAQEATSEQQREAAAHAYFSGCGAGRFDPDLVDLLDRTLRGFSDLHMRVFRWVVEEQLGMDLAERRRSPLRLEQLEQPLGIPLAIAQKLVDDLVRANVLGDCGLNKIGGYWGLLRFALSSFGRAFALYVEDARMFQGAALPHLESPLPPVAHLG